MNFNSLAESMTVGGILWGIIFIIFLLLVLTNRITFNKKKKKIIKQ